MSGRDSIDKELVVPTYSIEAEQSLLGALLSHNDAFDRIAGVIVADDFYRSDHAEIFRAISAILAAGKMADALAVAEWLRDHGRSVEGGFEYLSDLGYSAVNVVAYAEIVRDRAIRRAMLSAAMEIQALATSDNTGMPVRQMLDKAQAILAAVDERSARGQGTFRPMNEVLTEVVSIIDASKGGAAPGVVSGYRDLDRLMNPMLPGQLVVIGARPAVGKTSLAVNIGVHAALTQKKRVAIFSMEMTDVEIGIRILSGESGVPAGRFREHRMGEREWSLVNGVLKDMHEAQIHIDHSGGLSIQEICARARVAARKVGGFDLLMVDYVQLARAEGRFDTKATEIGAITSGLKRLAKELRCPVIALSQLNRDGTKERRKPMISDLRDSGSIESDADTILLLHRPYVVSQDAEVEFDAEIIVGKQRNGGIGTIHVDYDNRLTKFFDQNQAPGRRH